MDLGGSGMEAEPPSVQSMRIHKYTGILGWNDAVGATELFPSSFESMGFQS